MCYKKNSVTDNQTAAEARPDRRKDRSSLRANSCSLVITIRARADAAGNLLARWRRRCGDGRTPRLISKLVRRDFDGAWGWGGVVAVVVDLIGHLGLRGNHLLLRHWLHTVGVLLHGRARGVVAVLAHGHGDKDGAGGAVVLVCFDTGADEEGEVDEEQEDGEGEHGLLDGEDRFDPPQGVTVVVVVVVVEGVVVVAVIDVVLIYRNVHSQEA